MSGCRVLSSLMQPDVTTQTVIDLLKPLLVTCVRRARNPNVIILHIHFSKTAGACLDRLLHILRFARSAVEPHAEFSVTIPEPTDVLGVASGLRRDEIDPFRIGILSSDPAANVAAVCSP